jgi:MFS family permease
MKIIFSNDAFEVMHNRNFRFFMFYRLLMTTATLMQSVVVAWLLYNITKSVLSLGMIGLTEVIPQVSIALFAGHFVDIWDRKRIIFYTTCLMLLSSVILVVYSIPSFDLQRILGVWPIYITIFITGLSRGILMPANTAFLGQLVPRKLLAGAATWNSTTWQVGAVSGPALGGLVYGFFGVVPALFLILFIYLCCTIAFIFIQNPGRVFIPGGHIEGIFARMKEGIHYVFNNQLLLGAFTLDMFAVLFGGAVAMLPVFASDVLKVGPEGLGILRACPAIGAILMSIVLTFHPPVKNAGKLLFISVFGFGITMIIFALSKNFYLSAFILFLSGAFDDVSVVIRSSILQIFTSNEMKGRVAAVNSIFVGSSNELGAFESGVTARMMGLIPSVVFGGVMTLLVVAVAAVKSPALRKLTLKVQEK